MRIRAGNQQSGDAQTLDFGPGFSLAELVGDVTLSNPSPKDVVFQRNRDLGLVACFPPLLEAATGNGSPSSGALEAAGVHLYAGQVITNIGFCITAAAITPTHGWAAIYNSALALVAQSADNTAPFSGATGWQALPLTAPYTVPADGIYYLCTMQVAATPAAMPRIAAQGAMSAAMPSSPAGLFPWFFQGGLAALPNPAVPASSGNMYVVTAY